MLVCSGVTEVYYARKQVALGLQCLHVWECACECVLCVVRECRMLSIRRYWASRNLNVMHFPLPSMDTYEYKNMKTEVVHMNKNIENCNRISNVTTLSKNRTYK